MAMTAISVTARNARMDALVDLIDAGTTNPEGRIEIRTAGGTTLLGTLLCANPAAGNAGSPNPDGQAIFNAITDDSSADASGDAAIAHVIDRDANIVCKLSCGTSGADINFNTVMITALDSISITSMKWTEQNP